MSLPKYCIVEGRRPEGLLPPPAGRGSILGRYLASAAYLEAASAVAFARLARELEFHRAPLSLVVACERAREVELRHARSLGRLAQEHGGTPVTPEPKTVRVRPLVNVALDNIIEGFVRETYGAAGASFRARTAGDVRIREVMEGIAEDERELAELAFEIALWLQGAIDPIEGVWVEDAMRHAATALARELDVEVEPELTERAGVPGRGDALAIWSGLSKRVWHGLSERVWSSAAA
jgi:hypothetical protein